MSAKLPVILVQRNLTRHPVRLILTLGSLTVAFFLVCMLRSFVVSIDAGVEAARSDRLIVQSAVSLFVILPESYEGKIRGVEGVASTCRFTWFGGYYQRPENFFAQFGVSTDTFFDVYPEVVLIDGAEADCFKDRRGCVIGSDLSKRYGWRVGDTVPVTSAIFPRTDGRAWEFQVEGVYHSPSSTVDNQTLFFDHEYLTESVRQGGATGPDGVGIYIVKMEDGTDPPAVMRAIDTVFENGPQRVQATTEAEFQAQFVSMIGNIPFFVTAIGSGVFIAILLAVLNTMLMAAREQTHDVGILKALGFGSGTVVALMLLQSLLLCVIGGGAGVGLAVVTAGPFGGALGAWFPNYRVTPETIALGLSVAVLLGLVAGIAPAARLARLSCVESLGAGRNQ